MQQRFLMAETYICGVQVEFWQLGVGDYAVVRTPKLVNSLQDGSTLRQVAIGQSHTLGLSDTGKLFKAFCSCLYI